MHRRALILTGSLALVAAIMGTSTVAAPTRRSAVPLALVGTWTKTMTSATWHRNGVYYEPAGPFAIGIAKKGVLSLYGPHPYDLITTAHVAGSGASMVVGATADGFCPAKGSYTWKVSGRTLAVRVVKDDCPPRRILFTAGTWRRK